MEFSVAFEIEKDIKSDENYEFPERKLLIDSEIPNFSNIKDVFKANTKSEILQINFDTDSGLEIKGE